MHIELGMGQKHVLYYNMDKSYEVDLMLTRIAAAYLTMLGSGYPHIMDTNRSCKLIFSSESPACPGLRIIVSSRPYGIYTDRSAYHKQIARAIYTMTGLDIYERDSIEADVEIGVGGINVETHGYVLLKEAVLGIANMI